MEHHGNSKGTGVQTIDTSNTDSNTVRSPNVSDQASHEFWLLCSPCPRTPPRQTESWRIGDGDFSLSTLQIPGLSESHEVLLPIDLVISRSSSESRISPLTASAVTRATTALHEGPPFIVVRLVRELISVLVHAARFLAPARPISCSIRKRLTAFGRAPT